LPKRLLKDDGIICVTIDDYEMPRLFILMEEIFGEDNHLGTLVIRINPSGRSTVKGVSITHEYGLFFGKSSLSQVRSFG
jgi:adenine-specific DNA-methyltransferase